MNQDTTKNQINKSEKKQEKNIIESDHTKEQLENTEWVRVQIIESTEVNGVRFPAGIQIDVTKEDSVKIISSKKAELVNSENSENSEKTKKAKN